MPKWKSSVGVGEEGGGGEIILDELSRSGANDSKIHFFGDRLDCIYGILFYSLYYVVSTN